MSTATKLSDIGCAPVILRDDRKGSAVDGNSQPALAQILALQEKAERHGDDAEKLLDAMQQIEDLIKMLEQLKQSGQATTGEIASLEQMISSLKDKVDGAKGQVQANLEKDAEELRDQGSTNNGICNSALVEVLRILRELQDKYTELGVLYNKVAQENCTMSSQITIVSAEATKQGVLQEANKEFLDAFMSIPAFVAPAATMGLNARGMNELQDKNKPLLIDRDNLKLYQNALAKGPQANAIVQNAEVPPPPPPPPSAVVLDRAEQIARGHAEPKFDETLAGGFKNQEAINHMNREQLRLGKASVDSQHGAVIREINSNHETYSAEAGQRNLMKEMFSTASNAVSSGIKAGYDTERARDQAAATIAQGTQKQVDDMVGSNRSTGKDLVDQGIRLIDSEVAALLSANRPN